MHNLLIILCIACCAPLSAFAQQMDYATRQHIAAGVAELAAAPTPQASADAAHAVMDGIGLAWPDVPAPQVAAVAFRPTTGAVVEMVDIRLILAQIAVQSGARDHLVLTRAQGAGPHDVILLRGGFVGMDALFDLSRGTPAETAVLATSSGLALTRPLAIWSDAGLTLSTGETVILARAQGSFMVNLGRLDLTGGTISSTPKPNLAEPAFRPFVLTAGQGSLTARDAYFRHLGFGDVPGFGGLAVVNSGLSAAQTKSYVVQSRLTDVHSTVLAGTSGASIVSNQISGATGPAIVISQARHSLVANNDLSHLTGPHAIRIRANATDVQISDNLITGQARLGMLIDGASNRISVAGNLVVGSASTGIAADNVTCLRIEDNLIAAAGGAGISLKASGAVDLRGNAILFNAGAGLVLRRQSMAAQVQVFANTFIGNGDGLHGATPGAPIIAGNNLQGQMPRIFTGDLSSHMVGWLRAQNDPAPIAAKQPAACDLAGRL